MTEEHKIIYKPGERIISRGQPADQAFIINQGLVRVFLNKHERQVTLAELRPGAIFGESSLFGGKVYGAHVEAIEETHLGIITPDTFEDKMKECDPMLRAMILMLRERLRKTNQMLLDSETREHMDVDFI